MDANDEEPLSLLSGVGNVSVVQQSLGTLDAIQEWRSSTYAYAEEVRQTTLHWLASAIGMPDNFHATCLLPTHEVKSSRVRGLHREKLWEL